MSGAKTTTIGRIKDFRKYNNTGTIHESPPERFQCCQRNCKSTVEASALYP